MKLDLDPLPYKVATDIIKWCWERDIDKEKCRELVEAMCTVPVPNIEWTLDIPDKYITFFLIKWSGLELS